MDSAHLASLVSAVAAAASAGFAVIAWHSWRSQFKLSLPYVETECTRLTNAHQIKWNLGGETAVHWELSEVFIKGSILKLAKCRSYAFPNSGRGSAGHISIVGRQLKSPEKDFLLVGHKGPTRAELTFVLNSKASPKLRKRTKHLIALIPLSPGEGATTGGPKLFSGLVKMKF